MNLRIVGEYDILENSEYDETAELSPRDDPAASPPLSVDQRIGAGTIMWVVAIYGCTLWGLADIGYRIVQWIRQL